MRMRKKKNLEKRLSACEGYLIECKNESLNHENAENEKHYFDFNEMFGNENPLVLEIGCGKGQFATEFALQNPDKNIVCIEKVGNVIVSACELARSKNLQNIVFIKCSAEYLSSYIKDGLIETIFLNFSCPYPKNKHEKHRLTHNNFLNIYKKLLTPNGQIIQKTDNIHFFEFSIEQFSKSGFILENVSLDLHNSNFEGNIVTEYEKRFSDDGFPIYRLEARLKQPLNI